jgi:hypothetical protein
MSLNMNEAMSATEAQGCSAAGSSTPLLDPLVLQNVLSYVGPGHNLYVALVSKWWKHAYTALESQLLTTYGLYSCEDDNSWVPQTLYSSAFASPSRVQLAYKTGLTLSLEACQRAAGEHADVATLTAAHTLGMEYTAIAVNSAAHFNKLAEVQFLYSQGCPWPLQLLEEAASSGRFELLRWCYEHGCPWHVAALGPYYAAESGNVELMSWVLQQSGTKLDEDVMSAAASEGHTAMCQYLHAQQCPWDTCSVGNAAFHGHIDLLRWLVDNGCPFYARFLCVSAARGGSVAVLAYMQQQGMLTSVAVLTDMLNFAARYNNLAAAKWLRERGAEWPTKIKRNCPWSNEVLEWARTEGCTTITL